MSMPPIFASPDAQHPAPPPAALHAAAPASVVDDPSLHEGATGARYRTTVTASQPSFGWVKSRAPGARCAAVSFCTGTMTSENV